MERERVTKCARCGARYTTDAFYALKHPSGPGNANGACGLVWRQCASAGCDNTITRLVDRSRLRFAVAMSEAEASIHVVAAHLRTARQIATDADDIDAAQKVHAALDALADVRTDTSLRGGL